jgi:hypothetical protein
MIVDKAIYKKFGTPEVSGGTRVEINSKNRIKLSSEKKEICRFVPKTKGQLRLTCHFIYNVGDPSANGYFDVYVDDALISTLSIMGYGGNDRIDDVTITFRPLSTIRVVASTNGNTNYSNEAYVTLQGCIIDDVDKFLSEVIE